MSERLSTDAILTLLEKHWGHNSFLPLQEEAIDCILDRRDSVVVLPTGGGKSLCYQAPALGLGRLAVVVSPLISLMKDQVDALTACGVPAACVNSSQSSAEQLQVAGEIRAGKLRLLYVAPERLVTERMLAFLSETEVAFFAIDEAHCISHWGHDFRPEYRELRILKQRFPAASVHAFTATATAPVRQDIARQLGLANPRTLVGSFDRPNLTYRTVRRNKRVEQVVEVVNRHPNESGIIYCITKRQVDELTQSLRARRFKAVPYHAGLANIARQRNQDAFLSEKVDLVVATVAFGMGIDKSNVRFVLHTGMPKSLEHYQQEAGRAGRDGLESECVLLFSAGDISLWKKILEIPAADTTSPLAASLNAMANYCSAVVCRHRLLVEHFGQPFERDCCETNCDVCLSEIRLMEDAFTLSRKILSGIVRTEQRFGAGYVSETLVGSSSDKIRNRGHDQLSTFGLLQDHHKTAVRGWIDQLVGQGYLMKVEGEYPTIRLTPSGRRLLKGQGSPKLLAPKDRKEKKKQKRPAVDDWEGVDRDLFERLRQMRIELAEDRGVPAYVIFGDTTLRDLARQRPSSSEKLLAVRGIGEQKRQSLGEIVLAVMDEYCAETSLARDVDLDVTPPRPRPQPRPVPATAQEAFPLFREGHSIEAVAERLARAESTVRGYLGNWITQERITNPSPWVEPATAERIHAAIAEVGERYLKPIWEHLGEEVPYEQIRIVLQCARNGDADRGS